MAEKLSEYSFRGGRSRRRREKYPWDQWFNGSFWKLDRDHDFPGTKAASFRTTARYAAARRGLVITTSVEDDRTLVLQVIGRSTSTEKAGKESR